MPQVVLDHDVPPAEVVDAQGDEDGDGTSVAGEETLPPRRVRVHLHHLLRRQVLTCEQNNTRGKVRNRVLHLGENHTQGGGFKIGFYTWGKPGRKPDIGERFEIGFTTHRK